MRKGKQLGDEIFTMKKPDTSWHKTLVGVVTMIVFCYGVLVVVSLMGV